LLEESRVVAQDEGERNFNIFYQLCEHLKQSGDKDAKHLDPSCVTYLNMTGCLEAGWDEHAKFIETVAAMKQLGIKEVEKKSIFNLLKGILLLGNIRFDRGPMKNGKETSEVTWKAALCRKNLKNSI